MRFRWSLNGNVANSGIFVRKRLKDGLASVRIRYTIAAHWKYTKEATMVDTLDRRCNMADFGERVRQERERRGLTRDDLARLADMPTATLTKIEQGTTGDPRLATASRIAEALGLTVTDLLENSESNSDSAITR